MIFYYAPSAFENVIKPEYYDHMLVYVLFMRILCQAAITPKDLQDAHNLITYFCRNFENLYGEKNCTYKLHAHTHFKSQVINYGPLNQISCFPFEGKLNFIYNLKAFQVYSFRNV
jgi:hypothetical protein